MTQNAETIFEESIIFLGGGEKMPVVDSISGTADVTSPNGHNTTELQSATGDRVFFKRTRSGQSPFTAVVNGPYAWAYDPETSQPEPLDSQDAAFILGHDFLMLPFVLANRFHDPEFVGQSTFQNILCLKVEATNSINQNCFLYFAVATNRFLGLTIHGENTVYIRYAEWEHHQDILLPTLIVITDNGGEYRFVFNQILLNRVDESIFNIPAAFQSIELQPPN